MGSGGVDILALLETGMTIITAILLINHILLQADHKGDLKIITVNEIVLLIAIAIQAVETIVQLTNGVYFYDRINSLGNLFTYIFIVCMEARIQKYKARRYVGMSNETWTEEERQKCKKIFIF